MTISGKLSFLLCAVPAFKEVAHSIAKTEESNSHKRILLVDSLKLMRKLNILTSATYWFPFQEVGEPMDKLLFSEEQGTKYI